MALSPSRSPVSTGLDHFQDDVSEDHSRLRPWKRFWPPNGAEDLSNWEVSEFPEVSSWKFNPGCPFDRPWRTWTRTIRAKSELTTSPTHVHQRHAIPGGYAKQEPEALNYSVSSHGDSAQPPEITSADTIDRQIAYHNIKATSLASFTYLSPLEIYQFEKPYLSRLPSFPGFLRTNIVGCNQSICAYEVSGNEHLFTLDGSGFEFVKWHEHFDDWTDIGVSETYVPKMLDWLKGHFDCSETFIYAYNFRGNAPETTDGRAWKSPFFRAHCDATAKSCLKRLQIYLPDKTNTIEGKRVRFLNIWRALTVPLQNSPLALCDARTVSQSDLVATDIVFPHYLDEAYEVLHNPAHRWFFKQGLQSDDMIIFKLDDNADNVAKLCPHSAILDPSLPKDTPDRISIEIRAIVIG